MIKFKLREAMDNTHMNIEQLHKASGISRNTISLLFHGKMKGIRMSTLDSLATALKIDDVNELLEYQSKECPYCHSEENKDLPADGGTLAHIEGNGRTLVVEETAKSLITGTIDVCGVVRINYCPMRGRKLGGKRQ